MLLHARLRNSLSPAGGGVAVMVGSVEVCGRRKRESRRWRARTVASINADAFPVLAAVRSYILYTVVLCSYPTEPEKT
jgi:hypothetical protein